MSEVKPSQVLHIEPARELLFQGPFTDVVNASLTLKNPTDRSVCFKVKTTAPKQYCVRPNSGVINAQSSKTITVMLQPMDGTPADVARHKFMVQSCYYPPSDGEVDLDTIWKKASPNELMYSKLMVVFEQPSGNPSIGRVETPSVAQYSSPANAAPSAPSSRVTSGVTLNDRNNDLDGVLRSEVDARKKAENERDALRKEVEELFKKNAKLQQESSNGLAEIGVPTIQVILLAIAGLLIGLIVGKLF